MNATTDAGPLGWRRPRGVSLFVLRRVATMIVVVLVLSVGVFALLQLAPGSPEQLLLGGRPATPETLAAIRAQYNLDAPLTTQYLDWLSGALRLDFGDSIAYGASVGSVLWPKLIVSLQLGAFAALLAIVLGVPLGIASALRQDGPLDRGAAIVTIAGASIPAFATGLLLSYVFSVQLGWLPSYGAGEGTADRIAHLTLPAVALAFSLMALLVKITRASFARELRRDYVAFARARGMSERAIVLRHAGRNALVPILTSAGIVFAGALTGTIVVEYAFAVPGAGQLLVQAVTTKDIPVVQAVTVVVGGTLVAINLVVDLLYLVVDPRMRAAVRQA